MDNLKNVNWKDWRLWVGIAGFFLTIGMAFAIGNSFARFEIEGKKVDYDELVTIIEEKKIELKELEQHLEETTTALENQQDELAEVKEIIASRDSIQAEIEELNDQLTQKQNEVSKIDSQIQEKQGELASLEGKVKEAKEKPVSSPSGTFIVGVDLPANRYKAEAKSGFGNFIVTSSSGNLKVNQILDTGSGMGIGVSEHIFYAGEGDVIETTMPTVLIPVE